MNRNHESDLPDFLQSSPFLPLSSGNDEYDISRHVRSPVPKPTLSQILRSKTGRNGITAILVFIIILFLRSQGKKHNVLTHMGLGGPKCLLKDPIIIPSVKGKEDVDWKNFAYVQYVTDPDYLCNSVMIFEALHRYGSKAGRIMMYPSTYSMDPHSKLEGALLLKARDDYNVTLVPIDVLSREMHYQQWAHSYTKLLAFNQTSYSRLVLLDSDASLYNHVDELFLIPPARAAMPKAYWLKEPTLASHVMVIQPSTSEFARVKAAIAKAEQGTYDMEIVNSLYGSDCTVLPHRPYALLTGEFRRPADSHKAYVGIDGQWDIDTVRSEAKYVHFSDDPLPKPWVAAKKKEWDAIQPICETDTGEGDAVDCRARDTWTEFYRDFQDRRKSVCDLGLEKAPY